MSRIRIRVTTLVAAGVIAVMSVGALAPAASADPESRAILKRAILK